MAFRTDELWHAFSNEALVSHFFKGEEVRTGRVDQRANANRGPEEAAGVLDARAARLVQQFRPQHQGIAARLIEMSVAVPAAVVAFAGHECADLRNSSPGYYPRRPLAPRSFACSLARVRPFLQAAP